MRKITYTKCLLREIRVGQWFAQELPNGYSRLEDSHVVLVNSTAVAVGPFFYRCHGELPIHIRRRVVWRVTMEN